MDHGVRRYARWQAVHDDRDVEVAVVRRRLLRDDDLDSIATERSYEDVGEKAGLHGDHDTSFDRRSFHKIIEDDGAGGVFPNIDEEVAGE